MHAAEPLSQAENRQYDLYDMIRTRILAYVLVLYFFTLETLAPISGMFLPIFGRPRFRRTKDCHFNVAPGKW